MKINDVLAIIDKSCPAAIGEEEKIKHISAVEHRIINEALSRYDEAEYDRNFKGYDADSDGDKTLLAPPPYDEMYAHYVMAMAYLALHEQSHYNNELYIFNSILADYKVHLIQKMRPRGPRRRRAR